MERVPVRRERFGIGFLTQEAGDRADHLLVHPASTRGEDAQCGVRLVLEEDVQRRCRCQCCEVLQEDAADRLGCRMHLVSAFNPAAHSSLRDAGPETLASLRWVVSGPDHADAVLEAAARRAQALGLAPAVHPRAGDPADALLEVAEEERADLIVVGSKGMADKRRLLLGSVADRVTHHAPCSVMIVRTT